MRSPTDKICLWTGSEPDIQTCVPINVVFTVIGNNIGLILKRIYTYIDMSMTLLLIMRD